MHGQKFIPHPFCLLEGLWLQTKTECRSRTTVYIISCPILQQIVFGPPLWVQTWFLFCFYHLHMYISLRTRAIRKGLGMFDLECFQGHSNSLLHISMMQLFQVACLVCLSSSASFCKTFFGRLEHLLLKCVFRVLKSRIRVQGLYHKYKCKRSQTSLVPKFWAL